MKVKAIAALSLALVAPAAALAGGGGLTGGATEMTQLANNAELVAQVGEAVQTTSNTLMTAQATMQQLRQLPDSVVSEMSGLPIAEVEKLAEAHVVFSRSAGVYQDAAEVLRKAQADSERLGIPPSELLRLKALAAEAHGGVYKETYEAEQAKLRRLAEVSKDVQKQAETVKKIDSNVGGVQFIASQNVKLQAQLATLNHSVAIANANAAREVAEKKEREARQQQRDAEALDARRRLAAEPRPSATIRLPGEVLK